MQDGRSGAGPFSYEMGVKVTATAAAEIRAVRFYKSAGETGTHVGRIWTSGGTSLGTVTFANETASGWQTQQLATPLAITAGQTYVISVNRNAYYAVTTGGLASQITAGPVRSVVGSNGVYGNSSGTFPTDFLEQQQLLHRPAGGRDRHRGDGSADGERHDPGAQLGQHSDGRVGHGHLLAADGRHHAHDGDGHGQPGGRIARCPRRSPTTVRTTA